MPGFRHSPFEDIQRIRQDLRDRYRDGFPILKELLQNADDAGAGQIRGAATRCVIVLVPNGLPGGQHVLFRGAGLCILNDGIFTAEDANSITSLALSNKAGQSGAAGKFGLGLKSIFHWAEAFLYFSPHPFEGEGDPITQASSCELLNPWWSRYAATGRHKEWDEQWQQTQQSDQAAFSSFARGSLATECWFGLWIPLRIEEHTRDGQGEVKPIENQFPKPDINELFGSDWHARLVETLPMLRRVRTILVCRHAGTRLEPLAEARVNGGAERMRWGLLDGPLAGAPARGLGGKIEAAETSTTVSFSGCERFAEIGSLDALRNHTAWPSQSAIDADGGDRQIREKAEPHGAAVFTRQNANGQPALRVQHAVFLPLGEPEQVTCKGTWRYNLYLHGYFFVDSGRRHIQDDDELRPDLTPDQANSESEVIRLWNRILLREVVAPLVLPSLDAFVRQEQIEPAEIESLVGALKKSARLKKLTNWICRGQRFIHRLSASGDHWVLETCTTQDGEFSRWVELPAPDFPDTELFRSVPALEALCERVFVSLKGKPSLAHQDQEPKHPSDEELAELLGSVAVSAFDDARQLAYLLKLIPEDANQRSPDSPLTTSLVKLANQLVSHRLQEDEALQYLWRKFFQRLPAKAFIRLPCDSPEVVPEIARVLAEANLSIALLCHGFPEAEGQGTLNWECLFPVLRSLGGLSLTAEPETRQRSEIAVRLLKACPSRRQNWADSITDLLLFHACQTGGPARAASVADLRTAHAEERLFTGRDSWADLTKAAPEMKPLLAEKAVTDLLGLAASDCGPIACVNLLRKASLLVDDFASRKSLFDRLLRPTSQIAPDVWAALRCLLHGQISQWEQTASLYREGDDQAVFVLLARKALDAASQPWRLIPASVASQLALNADQERRLKLVTTSAAQIEALVKEVDPEKVACADLPREECDILLRQFKDAVVLRGLNIHDSLAGGRVRIGKHTYVGDDSFKLPQAFDRLVTRIRDNLNYAPFTNPDGENRLVEKLSPEAVIKIALDQTDPAVWAGTILTAIGQRGNLLSELSKRVRDGAWLPLADGSVVTPKALLHVPGAEAELDRLPDAILAGHIPVQRLAKEVQQHQSFSIFKSTILPPAKEVLATLATLLKPHAGWSTGLSVEWSAEQIAHWVEALSDAPEQALPIAWLVKTFHEKSSVPQLLPEFLQGIVGQLSETAYADVLKHLAEVHERDDADARGRVKGVSLSYLKAIDAAGADFARSVLARDGVRLLSKAGNWKSPTQLAFPTNGVVPDDLLCQPQADALASLEHSHHLAWEHAVASDQGGGQFEADLQQTGARLSKYFALWTEFVPREMIGAFMCILGDAGGIRSLAEQFLGQRSVDGTRAEIAALAKQQLKVPLAQAFANHRFACVVHDEPTCKAPSILGEPFEARLGGERETIFFGTGVRAFPIAGNWTSRRLHLLAFHLAEEKNDPELLASLLRASAEAIVGYVFGQPGIDLRPLWDKLSQPSQLQIRIAQNLVVDAAQAFLRQVGAHQNPDVQRVLKDWDGARRQWAEAEENNRTIPLQVQDRLRSAKEQLRGLLVDHQGTQEGILGAVRRKTSEYQYDASSVPFELWQNADDANVELAALGWEACHTADLGFVLDQFGGAMAFAHWGRLINEFQGSAGTNYRDRGYDRDLEKMLVQSISDKATTGPQDSALTGKFGLGFKSVFLLSDGPEVLSGSVDFVIRGGIYPVRLEEARRAELLVVLKAIAPDDWRRGTIIRLPLRADGAVEADKVLALFRRLASMLVVFSRCLKRLRFREGGLEIRELRWQPEILLEGGAEFGKLTGLDDKVKAALVLSSKPEAGRDKVTFLLGMNANGIVPLPEDVPVFWVTAPMRATPGYGFAVNGPFEPDVGRVQLALKSAHNERMADELALVLGERLRALWRRAASDWEIFREDLRLASSVAPYEFWQSLWDVLGSRFVQKCSSSDRITLVAQLARRILWGTEATGLQRFYAVCAALPTGLWGEYRALTCLPAIRYFVAGSLDREGVFNAVSRWPTFRQRVPIGHGCSASGVETVLRRLNLSLPDTENLHLATVLEWELGKGEEKWADAELAAHLGQLITPEFMIGLEKGKPEEREEEEHKRLTEVLRNVLFQAADGSWHKPTELVVAASNGEVEKDEAMRAAFAPSEYRLNGSYAGPALAFFLAARPSLEAGVDRLVEWVLNAASQTTQTEALRYLLTGQLKEPLAETLRQRRDADNWLWKLADQPWFGSTFTAEERHQLYAYVFRLFDQELRERSLPPQPPPPEPSPKHVWTVEELWKWWEQQGKPTADYTLEGEPNWPLFHGGPIPGEEERKEELKRLLLSAAKPEGKTEGNALWYRLFGYACLLSAGRHTTELRRFWTARLNSQKFWERTSNGDFSEKTRQIFEQAFMVEFTDLNAGGEQAYLWRRVFYDIRKIHRMVWVNDFPTDVIRLVEEGHGQHLPHFLRTGSLPGPDQQHWVGTFGQSAGSPLFFVIRELVRLQVIKNKEVEPLAFFVSTPVRRALRKIGWLDDEDRSTPDFQELANLSQWLHDELMKNRRFGPLFLTDFDIPLLHMGITYRGNQMPLPPQSQQ